MRTTTEKAELAPLPLFDEAMRRLMNVPPPPSGKKAKRKAAASKKKKASR